MTKLLSYALLIGMLCAAACQRTSSSDSETVRDANYARAKKLYEAHDFAGAAEFYNKCLAADPQFANGHLELGLLCEDKLNDPIGAIYHYRRFLELKPDSEKRPVVEDFIERAKLSLATKLPQAPSVDPVEVTRLQNEKTALLQENAVLREKVAQLEKAMNASASAAAPATLSESGTTAATGMASAPNLVMAAAAVQPSADTSAEVPRARVYVVQKGDTLQSLALRYYGTRAAWEKIYQANRSGLASKDQLKVGQQLVIP